MTRGDLCRLILWLALVLGAVMILDCNGVPPAAAREEPAVVVDGAAQLLARVQDYTCTAPGAPGTIAGWRDAGLGKGLPVRAYGVEAPDYVVFPVLSASGERVGTVAVRADDGRWLWYTASARSEVAVPADIAWAAYLDGAGRAAAIPPDLGPSDLRLVVLHDNRTYWYLSWRDEGGTLRERFLDAREAGRALTESTPGLAGLLRRQDSPSPPPAAWSAPSPPRAAADPARALPVSADIAMTHYYQQTGITCGPASLRMVFDHWGEAVTEAEIGKAADTNSGWPGTTDRNLRRAAHFSAMSVAVQDAGLHGYAERTLGYAGVDLQWLASEPWFATRYEDLKWLVAAGYPVILGTYCRPPDIGGHYRVVKGYNDDLDVFITHDSSDGPDVCLNQELLVDVLWDYQFTSRWALVACPWRVTITAPQVVTGGETFLVLAWVEYPGPLWLNDQFPASSSSATLELDPAGDLDLVAGDLVTKPLAGRFTSGSQALTGWSVVAPDVATTTVRTFRVRARGVIGGASESYPPPGYVDEIGGVGSHTVYILPGVSSPVQPEPPAAARRDDAIVAAAPNPFNPRLQVVYALARPGPVRLTVHDLGGRRVATLVDGPRGAGEHTVDWSGKDDRGLAAAAGIYLLRLETADAVVGRKVTLAR